MLSEIYTFTTKRKYYDYVMDCSAFNAYTIGEVANLLAN